MEIKLLLNPVAFDSIQGLFYCNKSYICDSLMLNNSDMFHKCNITNVLPLQDGFYYLTIAYNEKIGNKFIAIMNLKGDIVSWVVPYDLYQFYDIDAIDTHNFITVGIYDLFNNLTNSNKCYLNLFHLLNKELTRTNTIDFEIRTHYFYH